MLKMNGTPRLGEQISILMLDGRERTTKELRLPLGATTNQVLRVVRHLTTKVDSTLTPDAATTAFQWEQQTMLRK